MTWSWTYRDDSLKLIRILSQLNILRESNIQIPACNLQLIICLGGKDIWSIIPYLGYAQSMYGLMQE